MTSLLTLYLRGKIKMVEKRQKKEKKGRKNSKKARSEKINNKYIYCY